MARFTKWIDRPRAVFIAAIVSYEAVQTGMIIESKSQRVFDQQIECEDSQKREPGSLVWLLIDITWKVIDLSLL